MRATISTKDKLRLGLRLTPHQLAKARADVLRVVQDNLSLAQEVLEGEAKWSARQVSLFLGLLNKVIPPAGELWPEPAGNTDLRNASVADLERMLAEVLGGDGMAEDSPVSASAVPEPACTRDRREYFRNYESQHPERKKQREEIRRRRQKSLREVRTRIQARKAGQSVEIMPTRAEDNAKRCGLAWKARRQRWLEAERQIRQAQKRKKQAAGRGNAGSGQSARPQSASARPPSALATWRGVRLDRLDTPLTQLVGGVTGGQFFE
jgi:hypothetical protein